MAKEPKIKKRFKDTVFGRTINGLVKGGIIEAASLIPIVGHKLSNRIEETMEVKDATPRIDDIESQTVVNNVNYSKIIGQLIIAVFIILYALGKIAPEKVQFVFDNVGRLFA